MEERIFNDEFFKKLQKIHLNINLRITKGLQGGRKSHAKGMSVEFSDFREYVPGDDFRRVDWNAYGRFDKLFIKVFMEEREGIFNIFLDKSASMDYGEKNKKIKALQIVGALSYIALNNLDRVNVNILEEDSLYEIKGGTGKKVFQNILKELENIEFNGKTKLSEAITKRKINSKGVSIIVSDFLCNDGIESLEKALKYLAYKKQEIILIQVLCEEEINPKIEEEVTLLDKETKEEIKLNLNYKVIEEYKKALKNFNKTLETLAKKYGGKVIFSNTNMSLEEIILGELGKNRVIN